MTYRKDAIEASLKAMGLTCDAVGVSALSRELEQISAELIAMKYPALQAEQFLPQRIQVARGVMDYTWNMYELAGRAVDMSSHMSGAPLSGATIGQQSAKMKHIAAAYGFSKMELEAFAKSGHPLDRMRAEAARRAIAVESNRVALFGDSNYSNCKGLLNLDNTLTSSATADFLSATAAQLLADLFDLVESVPTNTAEIEAPNRILMPNTVLRAIKRTRLDSSYSDRSIFEYFSDHHPEVQIVGARELEDIGGGLKRMVAYNDRQVSWLVGYNYEEEAPEKEGFSTKINASAHVGGVITAFPKSVHYKTET